MRLPLIRIISKYTLENYRSTLLELRAARDEQKNREIELWRVANDCYLLLTNKNSLDIIRPNTAAVVMGMVASELHRLKKKDLIPA